MKDMIILGGILLGVASMLAWFYIQGRKAGKAKTKAEQNLTSYENEKAARHAIDEVDGLSDADVLERLRKRASRRDVSS